MYLQSQEQSLRFRVPVSGKVPVFSGIKVPVPVKVPVFENLEFLVPVFSCLPVSGFSSSFMSIIEKLYTPYVSPIFHYIKVYFDLESYVSTVFCIQL